METKVEGMNPDWMRHSQKGQIPTSHPVWPGLLCTQAPTSKEGQHLEWKEPVPGAGALGES